MRVLLVGATSALAGAVRPALARFASVVGAGRRGCEVAFDLGDPPDRIRIPEGVDAVVHLAAHFGGKSASDVLAAETLNVLGTLKLCQAASAAGVRHFVLVSTVFVELGPDDPQFGAYSVSKRHAEDVAGLWCRANGLPLAVVRPSRVYGDHDGFRRHQPMLYAFADQAQAGAGIALHGRHDALRNYIHAEDVAAGIAGVVEARMEGVFTAAFPRDVTLSETARAALAAFNSPGGVSFLAGQPDIRDSAGSRDDLLWRKTGHVPSVDIQSGMHRIAAHRRTA